MKQLLIPLLSVVVVVSDVSKPSIAQLYEAVEARGTQDVTWINDEGATSNNAEVYYNYGSKGVVRLEFGLTSLDRSGNQYSIEWVEGQNVLSFPPSCVRRDDNDGLWTSFRLQRPGYASIAQYSPYQNGPELNGRTTHYRTEPVNDNATTSRVTHQYPKYVECDPGLGEFTATGTSTYDVQKWWDGVTPNKRRTEQHAFITYRAVGNFSAYFSPDTVDIAGSVNDYLEHNSNLMISTSGGTTVDIAWPDVNLVEYDMNGTWVKGHNQSVHVTDGPNKINKRLRVRSSVAGYTTISVPVTMTLS